MVHMARYVHRVGHLSFVLIVILVHQYLDIYQCCYTKSVTLDGAKGIDSTQCGITSTVITST